MKFALPLLLVSLLFASSCADDSDDADGENPTPPEEEQTFDPEPGYYIQTPVSKNFGTTLVGYYEALPASYELMPKKKYPLLINMLGAGERGDGTLQQLKVVLNPYTPAKLIQSKVFPKDFLIDGKYYTFIVLSTQMRTDHRASPADIDEFIRYAISTYRVDESRIYFTGISLGAGTVWDYATENILFARKLAAITPMAGKAVGATREKARVVADANLPVWGFHSEFDTAVPVTGTTNNINWINSYKPGLARVTLFDSESHLCWTWSFNPTYQEADSVNVYEWMLMHQRLPIH